MRLRRPDDADRAAFRRLADAARTRRLLSLSPAAVADEQPAPDRGHDRGAAIMADNKPSNRPKLHAYFVKPPKNEGDKGIWIKVGAAFENRDGSLSLSLDTIPPPEGAAGWRLQLREPYDDSADGDAAAAPARAAPARGRR